MVATGDLASNYNYTWTFAAGQAPTITAAAKPGVADFVGAALENGVVCRGLNVYLGNLAVAVVFKVDGQHIVHIPALQRTLQGGYAHMDLCSRAGSHNYRRGEARRNAS